MKIAIYRTKYTPIGFLRALQQETGYDSSKVELIPEPENIDSIDMVVLFENHHMQVPKGIPVIQIDGSRQEGYLKKRKSRIDPHVTIPINYDNAIEELGIIIREVIRTDNN